MNHVLRTIAVSLLAIVLLGASSENLQLAAGQWHADLQFLAREIPKKHLNAFPYISKERFEAEVADLDAKLDTLDADASWVGMLRIASSIGDGHTKLVIDLRQNGGGDYNVGLRHVIHPIRDMPGINQKGHLFVLIGPATFSAAMSNATHFRYQTAAVLVGAAPGEKANSYQEPRDSYLPNSHLHLRYSTKLYKFVESGENIVRPDHEITVSWEDYKAGRDPALEWILKQDGK